MKAVKIKHGVQSYYLSNKDILRVITYNYIKKIQMKPGLSLISLTLGKALQSTMEGNEVLFKNDVLFRKGIS